jgi:hypothetical protein
MFLDVSTDRILAFAQHLDNPATPALDKAVDRGWLSVDGKATGDGRALLRALSQQQGTRSLFRALV